MLRPTSSRTFQTDAVGALIAWMRSLGATDMDDGRLSLGAGWIRVAPGGEVVIGGDGNETIYQLLLFECTEGNVP